MKIRSSLALFLIFSSFISSAAQGQRPQPAQTEAPPPAPAQEQEQRADDEVVRITTNLVQVDAVVTDKKGRQVTDLRPEEVEIYEDGRPQKITNFSYVDASGGGAAQPAAPPAPAAPADKTAPPVPPVRLRPDQVRRTMALVVDDLGLSFESTHFVREALKKFVDKQVEPGDLVAIIRTAGGMGALQQFTSDKRQLYAAIERVRWNPQGRAGIAAFGPIESDPLHGLADKGQTGDNNAKGVGGGKGEGVDQFREELFSVGTLGALSYIVRGMRELPGRKSILLMSDGFKIFNTDDPTRASRVLDGLRRLTDMANRASVVVYTMDARGLECLCLMAADSVSGMSPQDVEDELSERRTEFFESQSGLDYLARQTGGIPIRNTNDLGAGIRRVLEDQRGYYLIGYRPEESTFDAATGRRKFHKITLKVKRPGLVSRSRAGFYGVTNEEAAQQKQRRTPGQQLLGALTSPFSSGGVRLRLTSLFGNDQKAGSFVRSLLHVDGRDLTFTEEPDGSHKAVFDVLAVTFGDNGGVIDQIGRTHTLRVRDKAYERVLRDGFVYYLTVPVKKPGAYQLRTALRDAASERVGSASQFIETPDIKKNRLTVSGIVVSGIEPAAKARASEKAAAAAAPAAATTPGAQQPKAEGDDAGVSDPQAGPAIRRFSRGMVLQYSFVIFNAQTDKAMGLPQLQAQIRVFRDGKLFFTGRMQQLDLAKQTDLKRIITGGGLQLGRDMTPGEYVLQAVVTDPLAKEKYRVATQWIDFEIVK